MTIKNVEQLNVVFDFEKAQEILSLGCTSRFDIDDVYNDRNPLVNQFLKQFEIEVVFSEQLEADYNKFSRMAMDDNWDVYYNHRFNITFQSWIDNLVQFEDEKGKKREMKLGKWLLKNGFSQKLVDFYSSQIRTKVFRTFYLSIVDTPQHIAGCSYYGNGKWNGMGGFSCQHPEVSDLSISLIGSLYDDSLLVAFLHENKDDIHDLEGKALGRTMCRVHEYNKIPFLTSTYYYGDNVGRMVIRDVFEILNDYRMYSAEKLQEGDWNDCEIAYFPTNGSYKDYRFMYTTYYVNTEEEVRVACPVCDSDNEVNVTFYDENDCEYDSYVPCPHCDGSGYVYETIYIDREYEIEKEIETDIKPYAENYSHNGSNVRIRLNKALFK